MQILHLKKESCQKLKSPIFFKILNMKLLYITILGCLLLVGCGTNSFKEPNDFNDNWVPVNSFTETIETIPRFKAYIYEAYKLDGSLIGLLTRWAADSKLEYEFNCPNDFSLPKEINKISELNLSDGIKGLNLVYKKKEVKIYLSSNKIIYDCENLSKNSSVSNRQFFQKIAIR